MNKVPFENHFQPNLQVYKTREIGGWNEWEGGASANSCCNFGSSNFIQVFTVPISHTPLSLRNTYPVNLTYVTNRDWRKNGKQSKTRTNIQDHTKYLANNTLFNADLKDYKYCKGNVSRVALNQLTVLQHTQKILRPQIKEISIQR